MSFSEVKMEIELSLEGFFKEEADFLL